MFVTHNVMSALLSATSVLWVLGSMALPSQAQMAHPLQISTHHSPQTEAGFTPPNDSDGGEDLISTSTGTYFKPPKDSRRLSGPVTPGGSRNGGCLGFPETAFTAFGPQDGDLVVGQTVSSHPDFVWHLPESETTFPIIFRLLAPNEAGLPIEIFAERLDYSSGFNIYRLPEAEAALTPGTQYRWQVIVECNPAYPARALVQELPFEVVNPSTALAQALSAATTDTERALAYGQAGIWYDAIAQVAQATTMADQQTRSGLLSDLANTLDEPELARLKQDILTIVEATTPTP